MNEQEECLVDPRYHLRLRISTTRDFFPVIVPSYVTRLQFQAPIHFLLCQHRSVDSTVQSKAPNQLLNDTKKQQQIFRKNNILSDEETIDGLYEVIVTEEAFNETNDQPETEMKNVSCNGKYKPVSSKILPQARALPEGAGKVLFEPSHEPILREPQNIGHVFTEESIKSVKIGSNLFLTPKEEQCFKNVILKHQKAFAFDQKEIECVDPKVVPPMVTYTVPRVPWEKQSIPIPRSQISDLTTLIKQNW